MAPTPLKSKRPLPAATTRVIKALSLFSGVQAVGIIVSIVRTKLVALWIGTTCVGLLSLYSLAMQLIATATQFNINQSAVRDISRSQTDDARTTAVAMIRRIAIVLGIGGALLTMALSPLLSIIVFGDTTHTIPFLILASLLPLMAVTAAENAIMQGYQRLSALARSTLLGAIAGTAIAIPLYYFFRINAIVPVLVIFAAANCIFVLIYGVRTPRKSQISTAEAFRRGKPMLKLGTYLTTSTLAGLGATYIFMVFLNRYCGQSTVGLFNAGSTLLNSYVGIIFTAIAMEFYPRLAKAASSRLRTATIVSHEASMALAVVAPVIVVVICCGDLIMDILYSSGFSPAKPFVAIGIIAMALRAPAWCMAYTMIAKGDGRTYMLTECASAIAYLVFNTILFGAFGFRGLGVAYFLWYAVYTAIVYTVYTRRYRMRLAPAIPMQMAVTMAIALATLLLDHYIGGWLSLALMLPLSLLLPIIKFKNRRSN